MYHNKKGFTLVEIIVSIALASIILMLAGTLILSSTNLLNTSSERDLDKRTVDSVIEFVREEIEYATDVRILNSSSNHIPDYQNDANWHYFYIKDYKLYRDGIDVFSDGFYSGRDFKMVVKANYQNKVRVDIRYILNDGREDTYTSRDTLMLLNLSVSSEIQNEPLYPSEYKSISEESDDDEYKDGYRIYYNKKYIPPTNSQPENGRTGTVADIIQNISTENCKGLFNPKGRYVYQKGEIVWWNGEWWEATESSNESEYMPGKTRYWKRLNKNWTWPTFTSSENKMYSSYSKGDIVMYNNKYFRATDNVWCDSSNYLLNWFNINVLIDDDPYNNYCVWELILDTSDLDSKEYISTSIYKKGNILEMFFPENLTSLKDPTRNGIDLFDNTKSYKQGDIVKIKNNYNDQTYFDLYFKIDDVERSLVPGGSPDSGWMKIDILFDTKSSYIKNACLKVNPGSLNYWQTSQQTILFDSSAYLQYQNDYWKNS